MHGYAHSAVLANERGFDVARVWHGGSHEYPHAVVSGEFAQAGSELIRASFPEHKVSRVDVRQDFGGEGAYDAIQPALLDAAQRHRVKVNTAGDHLLTMKGRTCYVGSPKSNVMMRLYDKAEQLRAQLAVPRGACPVAYGLVAGIPEHLARLEAQIRPKTAEQKAAFATMEPVEALGAAHWMREVWKIVAGLELQPVKLGQVWRPADHERAYRFLLGQYARVFRQMHQDLGSWECVGLQIGSDLAEG
jgi:hypothetical protein